MAPESKKKEKRSAFGVISVLNVSETWIEHVVFSHSGNHLAACSHTAVYTYSRFMQTETTEEICECKLEHPDIVWKSVFSQHDKTLFTSCADGYMYAWDLGNFKMMYKIEVESEKRSLFGIAISPDGQQAALSSVVGNIKVFCLTSKEVLASVSAHNESIEDITYSPSGQLLASCAKDGRIKVWSNIEFPSRSVRNYDGHTHWVYSCRFAADETSLISASADKTIRLWSVEKCECLKTFSGHKSIVWCAQFVNHEATAIVSCSTDGTIR